MRSGPNRIHLDTLPCPCFKAKWETVHVSSTAEASPRTRGNGTDIVHVCARWHQASAPLHHQEPLSIVESLLHFPQCHSSCREHWWLRQLIWKEYFTSIFGICFPRQGHSSGFDAGTFLILPEGCGISRKWVTPVPGKAEPHSATCRTGILGAGTCLRSGMQVSSYFTPSSNGERNYRNWLLWSKYM